MTAYQINDRVYVKPLGLDGPAGNATVIAAGQLDGIGNPIATVWLDEYITYTMGRMTGCDASGQPWREWTVQVSQLRPLERAA